MQRDPGQRPAFLAQSCAGDDALYGEVKSLLTSYEQSDSFFEASASALAAEMCGDRVGQTIGPYQVLSVLGAGGMGTVYLAHDGRLGRRIALKLRRRQHGQPGGLRFPPEPGPNLLSVPPGGEKSTRR